MNSNTALFTFLDHTADMGIRVTGKNLKDLLENAARSMIQIMIKGGPGGKTATVQLSVSGEDYADLMVRWLGEILYLFEGDSKIVINTEISSIRKFHLNATLQVAPFNPEQHEILTEIKAVTYHQIEVARKKGLWHAKVIFDL